MKKILVAEDEVLIADAMKEVFSDAGYEVVLASNGEECLSLIDTNNPDFLILDVVMPIKDGIDVLNTLMMRPVPLKIPIIVLTNMGDFGTRHAVYSHGTAKFMVKSDTSMPLLLETVNEMLSKNS